MPLRISKRESVTSDLQFRKVAVVSSAEDTDWWQEEADIGEQAVLRVSGQVR